LGAWRLDTELKRKRIAKVSTKWVKYYKKCGRLIKIKRSGKESNVSNEVMTQMTDGKTVKKEKHAVFLSIPKQALIPRIICPFLDRQMIFRDLVPLVVSMVC
jgi:hypothetical protein